MSEGGGVKGGNGGPSSSDVRDAMGMAATVGPGNLVPKPTCLQLRALSAHWLIPRQLYMQ